MIMQDIKIITPYITNCIGAGGIRDLLRDKESKGLVFTEISKNKFDKLIKLPPRAIFLKHAQFLMITSTGEVLSLRNNFCEALLIREILVKKV